MTYVWKIGSKHNVKAEVAGKVCADLEEQGLLTAHNLVEVSRAEDAPLHKCFEWDDAKAGQMYRETQARILIRHIEIKTEDDDEDQLPRMPMYVNLKTEERTYEDIRTVIRHEDKRDKLLENAKNEMISFRTKYAVLQKLAKVFEAMDEVLERGDA